MLRLLGFALLLVADEDPVRPQYDAVLEAHKAGVHATTIERAARFLEAHPGYKFAHSVLYMTAEAQFRLRRFEECIATCDRYRREFPGRKYEDELAWRRAMALFKARRPKEAAEACDAFLRERPDSTYASGMRALRARIDPKAKRVEGALVLDYEGSFRKDPRFHERVGEVKAALPVALRNMRERLLPFDRPEPRFLVRFDDGPAKRDGLHMISQEEIHGGRVVQALTIRTGPLVEGDYHLERTLTHEVFHCWQREALGESYYDLPKWVREGIALWVARQGDERIQLLVVLEGSNPSADPMRTLVNGLAGAHSLADYGEDYLALEFIEMTNGVDAAKALVRRLFESSDYPKAIAEASGLAYPQFLNRARDYARRRFEKALEGREAFLPARRLFLEKRYAEARAAYEALPPGPFRPRALADLSVCCRELGDAEAAAGFLAELRRFYPHYPVAAAAAEPGPESAEPD